MPNWITEQIAVSGAAITPDRWPQLAEEMGISAVINLRKEHQDVFVQPFPVAYLWLPVEDHTDPTLEQILLGVQFIDTAVQAGKRVLVHCKMGIGRSPTMAAAYFVWKDQTVTDAIRQVEGTRRIMGPVVSRVALNELAAYLKQKSQD